MPPTITTPARTRTDVVPTSFEELYRHYFTYVVKYVIALGIDPQNAEDVAQTVLTKFFEKDALSDYDPDKYIETHGRTRKAMFGTFLSGFVRLYVMHYRDRQWVLQKREGTSLDTTLTSNEANGVPIGGVEGARYDWAGPSHTEEYEDLHFIELVTGIRSHLASVPARNAQDQCNMVDFFNAVLQQTYDHGKIDTAALVEQFGVSKTSIQNWLKRLRNEVRIVIAED